MSAPDEDLLGPWIPAGFDEFWARTVGEVDYLPLPEIRPEPSRTTDGHRISTFSFPSISPGLTLNGWIASPLDEGVHPAFLWVPPYSRWSMQPNEYGTRPGFVSMSLNLFGESAFHDEVYSPERGYFAENIGDPETWIFRRLFQDCFMAARLLASLPFVDKSRIASMGMSQGAGISIWLGAFCPLIKSVVADMPFLSGMRWVLSQKLHRYPLKELADWDGGDERKREQMLSTIAFFDTANVATRCKLPTLVTAGAKDPAVKVVQAESVYRALPGKKEFEVLDWGHDWHISMLERNLNWLKQTL